MHPRAELILPLLDSIDSIEALVRNMALSYAHLGRLPEGKLRYHEWLAELGDTASLMDETDQKKLAAAQALFG